METFKKEQEKKMISEYKQKYSPGETSIGYWADQPVKPILRMFF